MRKIVSLLLTLFIFIIFGAGFAKSIEESKWKNEKLAYSLRERVFCEDTKDDLYIVWFFLRDRGEYGLSGKNDLDRASNVLSTRALRRRRLRGIGYLDSTDLPVYSGYVEEIRNRVLKLRHVSRYFNAISAYATGYQIIQISSLQFVREIREVAQVRLPLGEVEINRDSANGFALNSGSHELSGGYGYSFYQLQQINLIPLLNEGYNGSGSITSGSPVRIAILDTGFNRGHEALKGVNVVGEWDFVNNDPVTKNESGDSPFQENHGTYVLGTIAGHEEGKLIGPAWGSEYLLAKTEIVDTEIVIEEDNWVAGLEWADSAGADIVTSSLGYYYWYSNDELDGNTALCTKAADIAVSHGIIVVNSAGNRGYGGLVAPADGDSVLAVGAVDERGEVAYFSSRGPTADGRVKPDLVAQGVNIYTVSVVDSINYTTVNGTSFSAPLIAGSCALLLEIHPDWDPIKVVETIKASASRAYMPVCDYGWGIPDVATASGLEMKENVVSVRFEGPMPNPFSDKTSIAFFLPRAMYVIVDVYDVRGANLKHLYSGYSGKLWNTVSWDGTDEHGNRVSPGVYFISVRLPGAKKVLKTILLY